MRTDKKNKVLKKIATKGNKEWTMIKDMFKKCPKASGAHLQWDIINVRWYYSV
jgi:hypothetical protein